MMGVVVMLVVVMISVARALLVVFTFFLEWSQRPTTSAGMAMAGDRAEEGGGAQWVVQKRPPRYRQSR